MKNRATFLSTSLTVLGATTLCSAARVKPSISSVAGYTYQPPNLKKGCRLLFVGDSITDMKRGRNEKDRNHYLGHSYVYLIAARLGVELAQRQLDFYNRGVSGNTIVDLRNRWTRDAINLSPDLLSILIGTNDVGRGIGADPFERDYRFILDASFKANPALRLVLLDPFVLQSGKLKNPKTWHNRRSATDKLRKVVARLAKEYGAVHIPTQQIFDEAASTVSPEYWIWDGIHPLPQGHELIARNWIQEASTRWS